jgi:hypothetical protein
MPTSIFQAMQDFINEPQHRAAIDRACDECQSELCTRSPLEMAYRAVISELKLTGEMADLRSLWVFAFAPGGVSDIHRHSNSTQYTRAWRGRGWMRVGDPESPVEVALPPAADANAIEQQWTVISPGVFHQGASTADGADGWCVVSFQTAAATELQDEPYDGEPRYYIGETLDGLGAPRI